MTIITWFLQKDYEGTETFKMIFHTNCLTYRSYQFGTALMGQFTKSKIIFWFLWGQKWGGYSCNGLFILFRLPGIHIPDGWLEIFCISRKCATDIWRVKLQASLDLQIPNLGQQTVNKVLLFFLSFLQN